MQPKFLKPFPLLATYLSLCLLFVLLYQPTWAAPLAHTAQQNPDDGQEYVIQAGDSLYKISGIFYGKPGAYQVIIDATNAKAATDGRFERIDDPRRIRAGQRLWIPNSAALPIVAQADAPPSQSAVTATVAATTPDAGVRFVSPTDGETVAARFAVTMAATGLAVVAPGTIKAGEGHFHILVDTDFVPAGEVIIADEQHLHIGKGHYTTSVELPPGEHVLRLQFANGAHIALEGEEYQDTITVTVAGASNGSPGVRIVSPAAGATVPPTVTVVMTATGLAIEPAGELREGSGHFHILVDTDFVPAGDVIITDEQHLHFGKAQTSASLALTPGVHTLRLQFANGAHIALEGEEYQDEITVTVAADASGEAQVRFVEPVDQATVSERFTVTMAASGLTVEPAGEINQGAGHFHILVDTDFVPAGDVIITDEQHLHFGKGQYTTTLELPPGEHVLRLQFANGAHIALDGAEYRDEITVNVGAAARVGPSVRFVSPGDGATVTQKFAVAMRATGLAVEPAGEIREGAGHFHILVDTDFVPAGDVIITDEQHLHFGKGQSTATVELPPGQHVLRLQFANGAHIALDGAEYQDEITVIVK